ncbi:hypothetical protein EC991_002649 [Linnemannia zychae]|nr:hypothetical protein EC991_002649 [Linnemannia zychae]
MEQLRVVRRNLRNCSPNSSYFRRYAAVADDWRNFLPQDEFSDASEAEGEEEMFNTKDVYDNSDDDDESELVERVVSSSKPPLAKKDTYTRTMPSTSSSMPSFVKELLREEELAMLVLSAQFNSHHNLSAQSASEDQSWSREDVGGLLRNESLSSTQSSIISSDDTEANDADADESSGPPGRANATTRRNRVVRTNGPRARYARQQRRSSKSGGSSTALLADAAESVHQHLNRRNIQGQEPKKIGPADKSPAGRRRSPRRSVRHYHHQQQYPQQPAHFGHIHLEDIVRGIESEFTLTLDRDEGGDELESEDSLTYLVSGYENSGADEDDEEEDLVSSVRRLHQATAAQRESALSGSISAASSIAESTSPQSTLLNSSDSRSEASVEAPSPSSVLVTENATLQLELPPRYTHHKDDQPVTSATGALHQQPAPSSTSVIAEDAAVGLAKTRDAVKEEKEKVGHARPSLKLQTHAIGGIAPGALSAFESRPLGSQYSLTKCNSTSSLYIDSTMAKSDVDETLRAVATVLYDKVLLSHKMNDCRTERIVNSSSYQPSDRVLMSQADIFDFMRFIFDCGQNLGAENAIITLIYVERMTDLGNLSFHAINWRRLLLGALILSIKVWEDLAVFNSDVCAIFEGLSVKDVNALERFSMAKLQYNVSVKRSVYAAYYFRLRDVCEQQYNLHYGMLTLSMSQQDFQGQGQVLGGGSQATMMIPRNDSCGSTVSSRGSNRAGSSAGLMGMGMGMATGSGTINSGNTSLASMTHHFKVPVGPGYRKWTLKPLSVREADRLEARSAVYCSNMMMEEQERKDAGCCLDEYSSASPEELHNLSATLLAAASMHTIASSSSAMGAVSQHNMPSSTSTSSSVTTMASPSVSDLATTKQQQQQQEGQAGDATATASPTDGATEPTRRVLRLKKSRSDFFFQNTTPASIM